ncbi:flagellar filament capping protein FliD [Paenibacillus sp. KS-LC4]|uniref:flagellar filament capping protein FliD n=1 Tax=Paenibacillus sp. KS-LC4 TaxID=2979727 RepID=UPI0030D01D58
MANRITGLASGMDVDSMVKEMMKARRASYDNMIKKRTKLEWQQEDYRTLSSKIVDFRNNKLSSFNLSSAISAKTSQVSGDANTLTINSTSSTASGALNVKVDEVATAGYNLYSFSAADKGKSLEDLGFSLSGAGASTVDVTINNKTIKINKDATLSDLSTAINASSSTLKATALYDVTSGKFSITSTQTGENQLSITDTVFSSRLSALESNAGSDAKVTINGISYNQAGNRFDLNGFDFTVKAKSASAIPTTITAVQDTSKIIDTIKSFVTEYNSLIGSINSELSEAVNRTYKPLTSDEKKEMTEDEIKQWEEKARSGTLRNDSILSGMLSNFRIAATPLIAGIVDSSGNKLSIGITTGSYSEKGKLVLDESKLRAALETEPDKVISLFTAKGTDTSPNSSTSGVFAKMSATSMTAIKSLSSKAGTSLVSSDASAAFLESSLMSTQIRAMKDQESRMLSRLNAIENQYFKQFSAMEKAISSFNTQSSALSSFSS